MEALKYRAAELLEPCLEHCVEGLREERSELAQAHARVLGLLPLEGAFQALAGAIREQIMEPAFFEALGTIGNPAAAALLKDIYGQDRFTFARQFIVHAMARIPGAESEAFLLQVLDDPDPSIQTAVVNHIATCGRTELAAALLQRLGKGRENTDASLARGIVTLLPRNPKVVQALQERLSQADPEGRLGKALITSLGKTRHPEALGALQPYTKSRDRRLKAIAIDAVCELEIPAEQKIKLLSPALREVNLRGEADPKGRAQAAVRVAALGGPKALETIKEMAQSQESEVRFWGCWALGESRPEQAVGLLRQALEVRDPTLRTQALKALAQLKDPRSADFISQVFSDKSDEVRAAAVEALGELGPGAHAHVLGQLEKEYRPDVVAPCLRALGATDPNPPSCWGKIQVFLDNDESMVRLAATEAASLRVHEEAVAALLERLKDPEHRVRRVAARALWCYGEARLVPRILDLLGDEDDEVRLGGALILLELGELHRDLDTEKRAGRLIAGLRACPTRGLV
jgi:HEAT repeat protein